MICWEASDQHGNTKRRPFGVAFCAFARFPESHLSVTGSRFKLPWFFAPTCTQCRVAVVSDLPIEAAQANHPRRGREGLPPMKGIVANQYRFIIQARRTLLEKGQYPGKRERCLPILTAGKSCC